MNARRFLTWADKAGDDTTTPSSLEDGHRVRSRWNRSPIEWSAIIEVRQHLAIGWPPADYRVRERPGRRTTRISGHQSWPMAHVGSACAATARRAGAGQRN